MAALQTADRRAAVGLVQRAQSAGLDFRTLYLQVFQPALEEIGTLWQINTISVADEHIATAITQSAMLSVYQNVADAPLRKTRSLVGACAESERHDIGLRMVCDFLDLEGWQTWYVGSSVPSDSLVSLIDGVRPNAVALSAALPTHVLELKAIIAKLRELRRPPFVLVGGRAFTKDPSLADAIGADATGSNAAAAVDVLNARLPAPADPLR